MGQKVHPEAMRVGYIHDWKSNWFTERNFDDYLIEDSRIRDHITGRLSHAGLSDITIRKDANESDQTVIQYFVADDPEDSKRKHLYRRETKRLTGDLPEDLRRYAPAYVMCEDVESLEFKFWDPTREEWLDEWRTTAIDQQPDRLPPRVEIKLGIKDDEGEIQYFVTQTTLPMQEKIDLSK